MHVRKRLLALGFGFLMLVALVTPAHSDYYICATSSSGCITMCDYYNDNDELTGTMTYFHQC